MTEKLCPNRVGFGREGSGGRCCCNCRYHIQDYYHCTTVEVPGRRPLCFCKFPKGWICYIFDQEGATAHSGWSEHGECECHEFK